MSESAKIAERVAAFEKVVKEAYHYILKGVDSFIVSCDGFTIASEEIRKEAAND